MSSLFLDVRNLSKHYTVKPSFLDRLCHSPAQTVKAVDGVSFALGRGQILGLVGQSGCGKTTLARTLLRLCPATGGEVRIDGEDILRFDDSEMKRLRRRLQIMFQDSSAALDPRYTARQCLEEPLLIHQISRVERQEKMEKALHRTHFPSSLLSRRPVELSGGQRQRLCLARALVLEPELLVLDEPLAGLDPSVKAQMLGLLLELRDSLGLSYLLISHDLESTLYACDHVIIMYQGRFVETFDAGAGAEALLHPYSRRLFLPGDATCCQHHPVAQPFSLSKNEHSKRSDYCVYAPECELAVQECFVTRPILRQVGQAHQVACHLAKVAEDPAMVGAPA